MIKINRKVEYALIVLKHLQDISDTKLETAKTIAQIYSIPFDTTSKMMQLMNQAGILESSQGLKGGYKLTKNLALISYLELTEIVERRTVGQTCSDTNCNLIGSCNIKGPITKLNSYMHDFLAALTLKDLLSENISPIKRLDILRA